MKFVFYSIVVALGLLSCQNPQKEISQKQEEFPQEQNEKPLTMEVLKDSLTKLQNERFDFLYFDLKNNEDALYFFESNGIANPEEFVLSQLMATNITKDAKHPLIIYEPRKGKKFQINKVKALNHRWVICDFSDGLDWGELILRYDLEGDGTLSFKVFDQTLYVSDQKPY